MTKLLTTSAAKLDKSQTNDTLSVIMYLDPLYNKSVCLGASAGCRKSCLINSGRMIMASAVNARRKRTELYYNNNDIFIMQLKGELMQALALAMRQNKKLAVRLNGTSDLDFSEIYNAFPTVQFYEYTKRLDLVDKLAALDNVNITFSKHENHTEADVLKIVDTGVNVAVVFKDNVPDKYQGLPVINGDEHDRRYQDKAGHIVGLKLKGTNAVKGFAVKRGFAV